jgi:flagellar basal-body rod modification protein FlgD
MPELAVNNSFTSINPAANNVAEAKQPNNELTQANFIELLVAQVKNQDPTKPMDPSQFMNQLTQSSMVNGLNELQTSFDSLATKLSSDQSLQAANLVGKSVLLPGGQGFLITGENISGQINLDKQASDVTINIFNTSGEQIKTLPLGGRAAGSLQFKWDGFADDGSVVPPGNYLVTAEALIRGEQEGVEVSIETKVDSISLNKSVNGSPAGTVLNLVSGQSVSLNEVQKIK